MPVASYKTFYDGSGAVTGAVWLASENDASKLVGADAGNVGYAAGPRPMYGAAIDRVLELDTGVGSLTRRISGYGRDFGVALHERYPRHECGGGASSCVVGASEPQDG